MTITQTLTALASGAEGETTVWLDRAFYPENCLADAVAAFAEHCSADVIGDRSQAFALRIRVAEAERQRGRDIVGSFLNYLLCLAVTDARSPKPGL